MLITLRRKASGWLKALNKPLSSLLISIISKNKPKNLVQVVEVIDDVLIHVDGVTSFHGQMSATGIIAQDANGLAVSCRNIM